LNFACYSKSSFEKHGCTIRGVGLAAMPARSYCRVLLAAKLPAVFDSIAAVAAKMAAAVCKLAAIVACSCHVAVAGVLAPS
jgi:hypothetical protein